MRGIVINFFIIHSCFCVAFGFSLMKSSNADSSIHYARLISGCGKTLQGIAL